MKKLLFCIIITLLISCKNDKEVVIVEEKRVIPKIDQITIDYENFEPSNTNLTSWLFVFSTSPNGKGNMDRVKIYTSEDEFSKDTKDKFAKITELEGADHVAKEMIYRIRKEVNFETEDLIVVRMKRQKETDTLGYFQKENTIYFCLDQSEKITDNKQADIVRFFKVTKGFNVDNCKPGLYSKTWQLIEINENNKKVDFSAESLNISFDKNGRCHIKMKCIDTQASFTHNDNDLALKYFQKGKSSCQNEQTNQLLNYLKEVENYTVENNQLHLNLDANSGKMIFE